MDSFEDFAAMPWPLGELHKGDLPAALNGFAVRFTLNYRRRRRIYADNDICGFGVALWLLGDRVGAAHIWANVCEDAYRRRITHSSYGCFQSPLLLWFASVWLNSDDWHAQADQTLVKLLARRRPVMGAAFSEGLARLLRKEITFDEMKAAASSLPAEVIKGIKAGWESGEEIQATFYAGVREREEGNVKKLRQLWRNVPSLKDDGPLEYYLLLHERTKLKL